MGDNDRLRDLVKQHARGIDAADGRNDGNMTRAGYGQYVAELQRHGLSGLDRQALEIVNQLRSDTNPQGVARRPADAAIDAYFDASEVTQQALQSMPNNRSDRAR